MRVAVISDIHDNLPRLRETLRLCRKEGLDTCICCGDVGSLDTLKTLANSFSKVFLAFGNMDYVYKKDPETIPKNIDWSDSVLEIDLNNLRIAVVHHDYRVTDLAKSKKYDAIFYGHTHTPWEKKIGKTITINPGEVAGQFGRASFAIFETKVKKANLILLK